MGILDAPGNNLAPGHIANLSSRLILGVEDAVWLNVSDSTAVPQGAGADQRWAVIALGRMAAMFPAVTFRYFQYDDTSKTYGTAIVVQTGSGSRTVTLYNAAVTGQNPAYFVTNAATVMQQTANLVTVNLGHNNAETTSATYRAAYYPVLRLVENWCPYAGVVLIAQNPRIATDPNYAGGLARNQTIMDYAASEGYGLINVTQSFLNTSGYATTLLLGDGLHPSATGSALWATLFMQQFSQSLLAVPRGPIRRVNKLYLPLSDFIATADTGTATFSLVGAATAPFPAWAFAKAAQSSIAGLGSAIPDFWSAWNLYLTWAVATGSGYTGSNNGVRWTIGTARHTGATAPSVSTTGTQNLGPSNALSENPGTGNASNAGAWTKAETRIISGSTLVGRPLSLRVRRDIANANDTLAETVYLAGISIERAA